MYKLHLILKYLRKRRIAWVSLIAVTLCTAMVIVVISVMGGWLRMFRELYHGLSGDVVVSKQSAAGFPYYEEMIGRIRAIDGVRGATPEVQTFGLINIGNQIQFGVQVVGLKLEDAESVNRFRQSLYRQYLMADDTEHPETQAAGQELRKKPATWDKPLPPERYRETLPNSKVDVASWPGMIVGTGVVGIRKTEDGHTTGRDNLYGQDGRDPLGFVRLTVLGMKESDPNVSLDRATPRNYWIVDDSRTGIWQYDERTVYVPLDLLQKDLQMDANADQNEPARATEIIIGLNPGYDMYAIKPQVQKIVDEVLLKHQVYLDMDKVKVQTWEEQQAKFLNAVEREKVLVTILFAIVSVVAIFLIFCIFYMIVAEKTRDIGIIKSVGATSTGVAGIFLGYGLTIGIIGGGLGLLAGYLIVHNINELHTAMGKWLGVKMWDPDTYALDIIPNKMNPREVSIIVGVAILSSLLGAVLPAIRAARMQPVEALRAE